MDRTSLIFCTLSLVVTVGLATVFYSAAAIAPETLAGWTVAVEPDAVPDIDMGEFGKVSVGELIGYYIENPPAPVTPGAGPVREVRFQGC
ncbi:MAG: hypothetical protein JKY68_03850 [Rhodospirillales bacterium]|nr:hypothetical protein [Rhodospirillales bacterium]